MKTRLYTRKRALISSVAMLLVAMIALGTATFAWFTSNPLASASGLTLKATASKGLVIQTASHKAVNNEFWGHTDYLNCNDTENGSKTDVIELTPASFDLHTADALGDCFTVEAANDNASTAKTDAEVADGTAGVYSEDIACKLTGATDDAEKVDLKMTGLTVTTTSASQAVGVRVAVEYNNKLIGVYAAKNTRTNNYIYGTAGNTYDDFTKVSKDFNVYSGTTVIGKVGTAGTDKVTVTVFLDGEDSAVYSQSISAANLVTSVKIDLSVKEGA